MFYNELCNSQTVSHLFTYGKNGLISQMRSVDYLHSSPLFSELELSLGGGRELPWSFKDFCVILLRRLCCVSCRLALMSCYGVFSILRFRELTFLATVVVCFVFFLLNKYRT